MLKICSKCKISKLVDEFHKHPTCADGLNSTCKECKKAERLSRAISSGQWSDPQKHKDHNRAYRERNRDRLKQRAREYFSRNRERELSRHAKRRALVRKQVLEAYGGLKCQCPGGCSETANEFLTIDHIDGGGTQHRKEVGSHIYEWLVKNNFPSGYRVLCMNCNHAFGHYGTCPHLEKGPS